MNIDVSADCAVRIEQHFGSILTELERVRAEVGALFAAGPVTSNRLRAHVEEGALAFLRDPNLLGGGFVAAPDALSDRRLYLAWWQGAGRDFLGEAEVPGTRDAIDYTRQSWFRVPQRTGQLHIAGPYVDFVCADEYVMTTTLPVYADGRLVGVAGADTTVETLERMLLPGLREIRGTLVNAHGRVVVSADPHRATGEALGPAPDEAPDGRLLAVVQAVDEDRGALKPLAGWPS
ncbi:cache domain-containing protein [Nocardioides sp. NPDC057772]|uniref:cache domain-containing protein n=1 Tax=Nocardioides sp. NPDC057772 TaxID=3346245 RepID=UPI003670604F